MGSPGLAFEQTTSRRQVKGGRNTLLGSIPSTNPDFLWSLVGSLHFMRLSLKKGAHVVLSRAAYRKSGESTGAPSFALFAKGGIVRSQPLTSHGKQTCSLGDLGFSTQMVPGRNTQVSKARPGPPTQRAKAFHSAAILASMKFGQATRLVPPSIGWRASYEESRCG